MMSRKFWNLKIVALAFAGLVAGCGSGLVDPVQIAVGNGGIPQLGAITSSSAGGQLAQGFNATNPFWVFNNLFSYSIGGSYLAPAEGLITQVDVGQINGTSLNYVTIVHSGGRLASRFYGVQQVVVRVGDTVVAGQPVGIFYNSGSLVFQVLFDGNPVCPLTYMSDTFRASFNTLGFNPCL